MSSVDFEVRNFDSMKALLEGWVFGVHDGKTVLIEGTSEKRIKNCAVMIKNGSFGIGCTWIVKDGSYPDDYPPDYSEVVLTGVVEKTDDYGSRALVVPKEKIVIK